MTADPRLADLEGTELMRLDALADPDARSVVIGSGVERIDIIVTRHGGEIRAYLNECPHAGTPLETFAGDILDHEDPRILVCSTHGARFRAADGFCVHGPCKGKGLRPVAVAVEDGLVKIAG